jgi:DNA invertase Pin-like site-specific DNA recombinase
VWSLDDVADSVGELVALVLELEHRNIRFRALADGFDSRGKNKTALKMVFKELEAFQERLAMRLEGGLSKSGGRRIGRRRALSREDDQRACALVKQGQSLDAVAKQFRVSRATLYRYLEQIKKGILGTYGATWSALPEDQIIFLVL